MAYYKNNSGYRNNNNYRKNNYRNNYNRNNMPQKREEPAQEFDFDATKYKKPDLMIRDMNGNVYKISGNFNSTFLVESYKDYEKVSGIIDGAGKESEISPEMVETVLDTLVSWIERLLSYNMEGKTITREDIKRNFGDLFCMYDLLKFNMNRFVLWAKELEDNAKFEDAERLRELIEKRSTDKAV